MMLISQSGIIFVALLFIACSESMLIGLLVEQTSAECFIWWFDQFCFNCSRQFVVGTSAPFLDMKCSNRYLCMINCVRMGYIRVFGGFDFVNF